MLTAPRISTATPTSSRHFTDTGLNLTHSERESKKRVGERHRKRKEELTKSNMASSDLAAKYRTYIDHINAGGEKDLSMFLHEEIFAGDKPISRTVLSDMLVASKRAAPDYRYRTEKIVVDGDSMASRNIITVTPVEEFMGIKPTGETFEIPQHTFYEWEQGKIRSIWVMFDKPRKASH